MRQNIDIEKWDSNQTAVESKHAKMLCYSYARFSFIINLSLKLLRKVLSKMLRRKETLTKETKFFLLAQVFFFL